MTVADALRKTGRFLRLTDEHGRLSLTNIGMLIVLVKLAMVTKTTVPDLGALLLSLAAYNGKKLIERAAAGDATAEHVGKLEALAKTVDKIVSVKAIGGVVR